MNNQLDQQILDELRKQTKYVKKTNIVILIVVVILISLITVLTPYLQKKFHSTSQQPQISWGQVGSAFDTCDYEEALRVAKLLTEKSTKHWYGYSYLGSIYNAMGDLKNAEANYAIAYELFPTKENKEQLDAIRSVLNK